MKSIAVAILALALTCTFAFAQGTTKQKKPKPTPAERLELYLKHAQTGSAYMRPQAARKLVQMGEPAAARILELTGETHADIARLGMDLVETFGKFGEAPSGVELRAKLWPLLEDSEFPWRPAVARGIAADPKDGEFDRLARFVHDPIAPVRLASIDALFTLTKDERGTAEQKHRFLDLSASLLTDENDVVRREAAMQLHARGHAYGLLWLLEDLKRTDTFFDMPTGEAARYAAMNALSTRGIELGNYNPELPPDTTINRPELARIEKAIRALGEASREKLPKDLRSLVPSEVPAIAKASGPEKDAVIGLQLRSCRRGDYFLRWTTDDVLLVGYGNPARIQLEPGTTECLVEAANETQAAVGKTVYWGQPGCDSEQYHMPRLGEPDSRPQILSLSKNESPTKDLRPDPLTKLGAELAKSIPSEEELDSTDARTRELAARVRAAFASIGGAVTD